MESPSPNPGTELSAAKLRRPSQIALALDRQSRVLFVNRDLAGTGFARIQDDSRGTLHELLHPDCDGQCRFNSLLKKAWKSLEGERASVEWEVEDPVWQGCLRLNLFRPLTSNHVEVDRRKRFALMTVTDITEIRREFQSVLASNKARQTRHMAHTTVPRPGPPSARRSSPHRNASGTASRQNCTTALRNLSACSSTASSRRSPR